jgi:hypothetical protein
VIRVAPRAVVAIACAACAAWAAFAACDPSDVVATDACIDETPAVDGQPCDRPGSRCPLQAQPGTVCFEAGGALAASAMCTCGTETNKWACDEDAALFCSEPLCSFGAPCHPGDTCQSPSRGTELICDTTGHLADCNAGDTMTMGCDLCTCQSGSWVCSTSACADGASD